VFSIVLKEGSKMFCVFGKKLWCVLLAALIGVSAAAQGGNAAHVAKNNSDAAKKKEIKFEVASIRPYGPGMPQSRSYAPTPVGFNSAIDIGGLILLAYSPERYTSWGNGVAKIINCPKLCDEFYVVNARVSNADLAAWRNQSENWELLPSAMRALLRDRFKLQIHEEQTDINVYQLVVSKKSAKLKPADVHNKPTNGIRTLSGGMKTVQRSGDDEIYHFYDSTMQDLADYLNECNTRPIRNATGIAGRYDFTVEQIGQQGFGTMECLTSQTIGRLGLGLKPGKDHGAKLIVDHVEKPTPN
jgi:uncharacterized protein (TIGR03435 family)